MIAGRSWIKQVRSAGGVGSLDQFGIEERRAHVEERGGEQDALARLVLGSDLRLAGEEGREELAAVIDPPGSLGTEGEQDAVVGVEGEVGDGVEGDGVLREPEGPVSGRGRDGGIGGGGGVVVVAEGIVAAAGDELNAAGEMDAVLDDGGGLMAVFPERRGPAW